MKRGLLTFLLIFAFAATFAAEADSIAVALPDTTAVTHRPGLVSRVVRYFMDSNKPKPNKKFDFSILGGPHYSSETKFGLGLVAAGLYKHNFTDTITPMSMIGIYGDLSSTGYYLLGIKGYHLFPLERYRINYKIYFYSQPNYYWGMGYVPNRNDENETAYRRKQLKLDADFMIRAGKSFYFGPTGQFCLISGTHLDTSGQWLWDQQPLTIRSYGLGVAMSYDTRDNISNAYEGVNLEVHQRFYPRFLKNEYAFSSTELTGNYYHRVWKGGVIATQLHAMFTYGNTPWTMMPSITTSNSLRGYYDGRYNDKCEVDATVELRQHVWRRNGLVAWVGAGNVFPKFSRFRLRQTLPNYGVGYRWEFKNRINVRLDIGFGRGEKGIVFNINEAF